MQRFSPRIFGQLLSADGGAPAAEFAIIFPAFFLLFIGIFEFARAVYSANALQFGVAQGARYVMVHKPTYSQCCPGGCSPTYNLSGITSNLGLPGAAISATSGSPSCGASQPSIPITVTGTYQFNFFLASATASQIGLGTTGIGMSQQSVITIPLN